LTLKIAAENDFGAALLPRFIADTSPSLQRIDAPTEELTTGLWALTHPDMIRSARVHAFIDHVRTALKN
jgi:DNA-binding transcriptional LysR family regulator